MTRVAVVGLGFMGTTHLGVYARLKSARVTAICDARESALATDTANVQGNIETSQTDLGLDSVNKYTNFENMLADGGFDMVDICLPTPHHEATVVTALQAGYHVICEKPMAPDSAAAQRMIAASTSAGKLFSVAHCLRHWPAYSEAKNIIDSNKYGRVHCADFSRFSHVPGWSVDNWLMDERQSGGPALDVHIHDTDMVLYLCGMPKSLRSGAFFEKNGLLSKISTQYFYDDRVATSSGGWVHSDSYGFNMRAFYVLDKAIIEMDFSKTPVLTVYPDGGEKFSPDLPDEDGYYFELLDFVHGIEKGTLSGVVSPQSAADSVKICLQEIESARQNREVFL